MIRITLPDGAVREYEKRDHCHGRGQIPFLRRTGQESTGSRNQLGQVVMLWTYQWRRHTKTADVEWVKTDRWPSGIHRSPDGRNGGKLFPGVKFWVGRHWTARKVYYDMDLGDRKWQKKTSPHWKEMNELAKQVNEYIPRKCLKGRCRKIFYWKGDEYKLDLLDNLNDGEITFYWGQFTDLCRGPHIPNTGHIKAIKLLPALTGRVMKRTNSWQGSYGVTFPSENGWHLAMLEEAKKRDHRKFGEELGIYTMDDFVRTGLILWMPNGTVIIEELEKLAKGNRTGARI